MQELKEMRRAGVRTFAEAENYEADRKRRALEEGGARGDRAHARHQRSGRADEDDPSILAQVPVTTHHGEKTDVHSLWQIVTGGDEHTNSNGSAWREWHNQMICSTSRKISQHMQERLFMCCLASHPNQASHWVYWSHSSSSGAVLSEG